MPPFFTYTCGPILLAKTPVQVEKHMNTAEKVLIGHPEAKAALEMALLDITGHITGLSVCELVGGKMRDDMGMSFSVANPDFDADLDDIAAMWQDGVRIIKFKTGFSDRYS